jgi:hypothetical protein
MGRIFLPLRVSDKEEVPDRENQVVTSAVLDSRFSSLASIFIFAQSLGVDRATFLQYLHTCDGSMTA